MMKLIGKQLIPTESKEKLHSMTFYHADVWLESIT